MKSKKELKSGREADELSVKPQKKSRNTSESQKKGKLPYLFNKETVRESKKYYEYFALVTNCQKNHFKCPQTYKKEKRLSHSLNSEKKELTE